MGKGKGMKLFEEEEDRVDVVLLREIARSMGNGNSEVLTGW